MRKITIAIDGYSSTGKSTLAKDLARALRYAYVDSGAMYRAVTLFFLRNNIDFHDEELVRKALQQIDIQFKSINGRNYTFLNGENVEAEIRSMSVSEKVSEVAAISVVRRDMVKQQQAMGAQKGIVMDGRDIGTVVFPDAELKIFLTADADIRARRRHDELLAKGLQIPMTGVRDNLMERDRIDSTRDDSPLRKAPDAIAVNNSNMSRKEQLNLVLSMAHERMKEQSSQ